MEEVTIKTLIENIRKYNPDAVDDVKKAYEYAKFMMVNIVKWRTIYSHH